MVDSAKKSTTSRILPRLEPSHGLFHSFCIKPNFKFHTQTVDEEVILVLRSHPITQIPWLVNSIIALLLLIIVDMYILNWLSLIMAIFTNVFFITAVFSYMLFNILAWFFNVGVITNHRILDIDFHTVIYREISETTLEKIQDITEKSGGFLESFIDYGDLFVQTAGNEQNIEFDNIPKPSFVTKIIGELIHNPT